MPQLLTAKQARQALDHQGKSIADFAREHSLDEPTVYQLLSGRKKGLRGEAHRAACLLGIKHGNLPPALCLPTATSSQPCQ